MRNLPTPPKGRFHQNNKWGPALASLLEGNVIHIPGITPENVSGNLSRNWITNQGFRVKTKLLDGGTAAWIERRTK